MGSSLIAETPTHLIGPSATIHSVDTIDLERFEPNS